MALRHLVPRSELPSRSFLCLWSYGAIYRLWDQTQMYRWEITENPDATSVLSMLWCQKHKPH